MIQIWLNETQRDPNMKPTFTISFTKKASTNEEIKWRNIVGTDERMEDQKAKHYL